MADAKTKKPSRAALNASALAERLGIREWQVQRAADEGILPASDRSRGWSADLTDQIVAEHQGRVTELVDRIGRVPDMGTWDAMHWLAARFQPDEVTTDAVRELMRRDLFIVAFYDRQFPVFRGRSIEAFLGRPDAREVLADAVVSGEELMADECAARLQIRRSDFDHLTRAGLIRPVRIGRTGHWSKSRDPGLPLYRAGDVAALFALPGIDWAAVQSTPKGGRSLLAKLPTAGGGRRG